MTQMTATPTDGTPMGHHQFMGPTQDHGKLANEKGASPPPGLGCPGGRGVRASRLHRAGRHRASALVSTLLMLALVGFASWSFARSRVGRATPTPPFASPRPTASTVLPSPNLQSLPRPAVPSAAPMPAGLPAPEQVLANLIAFTRLYGLVHYFHPSDAAAAARWGPVAENGATLIAGASSPQDLAARLQAFFDPIAPTVCVFPAGQTPGTSPELFPPADAAELEIVMWRHYGVSGKGEQSIYHSDRIRAPARGGRVPDGFHDPSQPYLADLGGGVAALVPLALYADIDGTLPHHPVPAELAPDRRLTVSGQGSRAAAVVMAWNVLAYFYPYWDVVETDWSQALQEALSETLAARGPQATLAALEKLVARLEDGHAYVMPATPRDRYVPEVALARLADQIVILHAQGSAARHVQPGDIVLQVDGQPAAEAFAASEARISGATPQWRHTVALQSLLEGDKGSSVTLQVQREGTAPFAAELERVIYSWALTEPRPSPIAEIEPGICYVALDHVPYESFVAALPQLQAAEGIVFDLRGYPQSLFTICHLIDTPVRSPQMLVPIVTAPDPRLTTYERVDWELEPIAPRLSGRFAFLIDGRAISAAETVLGMVEHYRLGELVGEATAGTNGNVNVTNLPGGYTLTWTGMKVLKQDGSRHHGIGILPTVPVSRTLQGIRDGRDEQLERALEMVRGP